MASHSERPILFILSLPPASSPNLSVRSILCTFSNNVHSFDQQHHRWRPTSEHNQDGFSTNANTNFLSYFPSFSKTTTTIIVIFSFCCNLFFLSFLFKLNLIIFCRHFILGNYKRISFNFLLFLSMSFLLKTQSAFEHLSPFNSPRCVSFPSFFFLTSCQTSDLRLSEHLLLSWAVHLIR
ncbi:unnamed protein product [Acanthosepion pharaonis]|uniref:Uncharacterized protein n=1 Tax=Acanthosepion pharaonis TaxID=158019 RepID=A0A812CLA7_ACAPH|nr:unnamed protein product [Sepia pharaonis]